MKWSHTFKLYTLRHILEHHRHIQALSSLSLFLNLWMCVYFPLFLPSYVYPPHKYTMYGSTLYTDKFWTCVHNYTYITFFEVLKYPFYHLSERLMKNIEHFPSLFIGFFGRKRKYQWCNCWKASWTNNKVSAFVWNEGQQDVPTPTKLSFYASVVRPKDENIFS